MKNRSKRNKYCSMGNGYYHFCTDGLLSGKLFYNDAQFAYGMILIGLLTLQFNLKIYGFVLMSNHIHIILSGTGDECVKAFDYLRKKINERLLIDGFQAIPDDYDFLLVPITDLKQMKSEMAYVLRNPLEKNISIPQGYPWGTGWVYYNDVSGYFTGTKASEMSVRELRRRCCSKISIPDNWQFHDRIGLLPDSFIDKTLMYKLYPEAKDYETYLVKDYESYVRIAKELGDAIEFEYFEIDDIVDQVLQDYFGGASLNALSKESKAKLVRHLSMRYNLNPAEIAKSVKITEKVVRQILSSKEYRTHLS